MYVNNKCMLKDSIKSGWKHSKDNLKQTNHTEILCNHLMTGMTCKIALIHVDHTYGEPGDCNRSSLKFWEDKSQYAFHVLH